VVGLLPVALLWRLPPDRPPRDPGDVEPVARFVDFLRDPFARTVYLAIFAEGFLLWGPVTYLGAYAAARYGLNQLAVGLLIALFGVGTMVGGALMGSLRRRLSHTTLQVHATEISQAARGKAFSLFPFSLFSGVAAGTAAMGPRVDAGGEHVMLAGCGLGLVGVGIVTARIRRRRIA
jgi:predicted MFS family arabinose efflux permease